MFYLFRDFLRTKHIAFKVCSYFNEKGGNLWLFKICHLFNYEYFSLTAAFISK